MLPLHHSLTKKGFSVNMKKQLYIFIRTYLLFVVVFIIQKPLFMWYYHGLFTDANPADYLQVMLHGLPLDLSIAGYLSVIPALLQIVSLWLLPHFAQGTRRVYFALISFVMATVFVSDMALYRRQAAAPCSGQWS